MVGTAIWEVKIRVGATMTDQELIKELQQLTENLVWMSETDAPLEVIQWDINADSFDAQDLLHHLGLALDTPVETQSLESFFKPATTEQNWHNEAEQAEVKRYQELLNSLRSHLEDVQVYKIGKVEIDVYILGKTVESNIAGVKTKVVET